MLELISIVALFLLSLLGYSIGAISTAGKSRDLKPMIIDLVLISFIWAGAIYSRLTLHFNRWLLILILLFLAGIIGIISVIPRKSSLRILESAPKDPSQDTHKRPWIAWKAFSLRLGSFQSRVWLSLFFFIFISPAAVLVRTFSDPLGIKKCSKASHWVPKKEIGVDLEQYRRQF